MRLPTSILLAFLGVTCTLLLAASDRSYLRATYRSQIVQNSKANEDDLSRMRDLRMVRRFARLKLLERVPKSTKHYSVPFTKTNYRYLRPWTKLFLTRLSAQHHAKFKKKLRVTSLLRTVAYQKSLRKRNGNAAAASGPRASTHLTGATLDISKNGMTGKQIVWMRRVLASLKKLGYVYAVEEFRQPVFHVMVYKKYVDYVKARKRAKLQRSAHLETPTLLRRLRAIKPSYWKAARA